MDNRKHEHVSLSPALVERFKGVLNRNAASSSPIFMDSSTTLLIDSPDNATDEEVINSIQSVPCHY
jgi:hypothetical protein